MIESLSDSLNKLHIPSDNPAPFNTARDRTDEKTRALSKDRIEIEQMLMQGPRHRQIVEIQLPTLNQKKTYLAYLVHLHADLKILEKYITELPVEEETPLLFLELKKLNLVRRIEDDIRFLGGDPLLTPVSKNRAYFEAITSEPHQVLIHYINHLLGILNGGQSIKIKLEKLLWGYRAVELYNFENVAELKFNLKAQDYISSLSDSEYSKLKEEIDASWQLVFALFHPPEEPKGCASCIRRILNRVGFFKSHLD